MIFTITLTSFSIDLIVNDKKISTEDYQTKPEIINDRTYVPLRFVSDALGYNVNWDGDSKQVLISNSADPMSNVLPENPEKNLRIVLNGKPMFFPVDYGQPFINSQSITMVPVRGVSEAMKLKVSFTNNTVYISGNTDPDVQTVPVANTNEQEEKQTIKDSYSFDLTIFGEPLATREQLVAYTKDRERSFRVSIPQVYGRPYIEIPDLIDYYLEIGKEYGIRGDIAYLQAIKETNFFQFTGIVQPHQNNYSGIWATGSALTGNEPYNGVSPDKMRFEPGVHGVTFASPRIGVEAQIQHLYAYATTAPLPQGKELLSPRFIYVNRGCAPRWVDLGGKWAYPGYEPSRFSSLQEAFNAGKTYGHSILEDYLAKVLAY
jgi:hypothetical protein